MGKSPTQETLVPGSRPMPRLVHDPRDMLPRVMCSRRLPNQQFSVPCVQELLELPFVVEGRQDDVSPLPTLRVIPVVPRNEPPDAVITGVDCAHEVRVSRWDRAARGVADSNAHRQVRESLPLARVGSERLRPQLSRWVS